MKREFNPVSSIFIDQILILLFVLIGQFNHGEMTVAKLMTFDGLVQYIGAAFPFMLAAFLGWAGLILRSYYKIMPAGLVVWATTVVLGMMLRVMNGQTIQPAFVAVAAVILAVLLLGWRLIAVRVLRDRPVEADTR